MLLGFGIGIAGEFRITRQGKVFEGLLPIASTQEVMGQRRRQLA